MILGTGAQGVLGQGVKSYQRAILILRQNRGSTNLLKGVLQAGVGSNSSLKIVSNPSLPIEDRKLVCSDVSGDEDVSKVVQVSLEAKDKEVVEVLKENYMGGAVGVHSTADDRKCEGENFDPNGESKEVDQNEQDMEVDDILLIIPRNQTKEDFACGDDELQNNSPDRSNNKKQRTFRRKEKTDRVVGEVAKSSLEKKRNCDFTEGKDQGVKRQKIDMMWWDEEGDIVEVETYLNPDKAGLPVQFRQTI
jgi:hypothetical protein